MDTLPGTSRALPPGTRRRLNPDNSEKGLSHLSRFHPFKPPPKAPKASTSGTDENTNPMCTSASPAFDIAPPVQLGTLLPVASLRKPAVFGTYSQKQANKQESTSQRIQDNKLVPTRTRWSELSEEKREKEKRDIEWRQNVSTKEYRQMVEEGDTSQNFQDLQAFVQGR